MTPAEMNPPTLRSSCLAVGRVLVLVAIALSALKPALAQVSVSQQPSGFVVVAPSDATYSHRNGLRLEVDSRWPFSFGYRPIRVRITSEQPTTAEHRITIRFHIAAWEWRYLDVSQSFDLPQGATEASAVISCPQLQSDYRYWWELWVDGVREGDLCFDETASWNFNASGNANAANSSIKFLVVGPASKSHKLMGAGNDTFVTVTLPIAELPERWIDYSAVDVVVVTPDDLDTLSRTRTEVLTALGRWVRTGGQLWVHSVGRKWDRLGDVERLLQLTPVVAAAADASTPIPPLPAGWKPIELRAISRAQRITVQHVPTGSVRIIRDPVAIARLKRNSDYVVVEEFPPTSASTATVADDRAPANTADWYVDRAAGLGAVRAFRGGWDPVAFSICWQMLAAERFADPMAPVTPVTAAIETTRNWQSRHGMTPDLANEDFANLLVPGVGLAPVTEFRVLITLFVLVIGPLNYWFLVRADRLHLILFTVPLMAFGLTASLFAYALLSDGLSTNIRVRSFTRLDQTTGEAACWARLSYYSGLAPSRGLVLPDDIVLYPILPGWNETGDNASPGQTRKMEWKEGRQRLVAGWLRSRVPIQFLSVRARKSPRNIRFESVGDQLSASNELGTRITFIAAVNSAGNVFTGKSIADGAAAMLTPSTSAEAVGQLRELVMTNEPEMPPAFTIGDELQRPPRRPGRMFQPRFDLEYAFERLGENLQSDAITALVANTSEPPLNLPPNSYVAITETGPEVELGIDDVEELASFHVLVGNW